MGFGHLELHTLGSPPSSSRWHERGVSPVGLPFGRRWSSTRGAGGGFPCRGVATSASDSRHRSDAERTPSIHLACARPPTFHGSPSAHGERHDQRIVAQAVQLLALLGSAARGIAPVTSSNSFLPRRRASSPREDIRDPDGMTRGPPLPSRRRTRTGMSPYRLRSLRLLKSSMEMPAAQSQSGTPSATRSAQITGEGPPVGSPRACASRSRH